MSNATGWKLLLEYCIFMLLYGIHENKYWYVTKQKKKFISNDDNDSQFMLKFMQISIQTFTLEKLTFFIFASA